MLFIEPDVTADISFYRNLDMFTDWESHFWKLMLLKKYNKIRTLGYVLNVETPFRRRSCRKIIAKFIFDYICLVYK